MWSTKKRTGKHVGILLFLLATSASLFGEESGKGFKEDSKSKSNFVVIIKDNFISLNAKDASLREIMKEIGSRMKIEVAATIAETEKITMKFDSLSIDDAIKKFRDYANILYIKDSDKKEAKITKMVVVPKKKGILLAKPITKGSEIKKREAPVKSETMMKEETVKEKTTKNSKRPKPFEFDFDPSESEDKEEEKK